MTTRDKRNCMHLGTGLCKEGEKWALSSEPCDDCEYYLTREGVAHDRPTEEAA